MLDNEEISKHNSKLSLERNGTVISWRTAGLITTYDQTPSLLGLIPAEKLFVINNAIRFIS